MTLTSTRPATAEPALSVQLSAVGQRFGSHHVLSDVDLTVPAGEIVSILGPSGCGKSTLLRAVAGLDAPSSGRVSIGETAVDGLDPRCGVGFQEPRLLPWRTVRANVELGLPRGTAKADGAARVDELLRLVGLTSHTDNRPREISGGMAQRASLARALARRPSVLLLDEPFGALDALTRLNMQELLLRVHTAHPSTVLLGRDAEEGTGPATVVGVHDVPGARPRKDDDPDLIDLRHKLLAQLGVHA
jgi:sulfonate transport system ATP-binding protein